jgi:Na+/proline symporter
MFVHQNTPQEDAEDRAVDRAIDHGIHTFFDTVKELFWSILVFVIGVVSVLFAIAYAMLQHR